MRRRVPRRRMTSDSSRVHAGFITGRENAIVMARLMASRRHHPRRLANAIQGAFHDESGTRPDRFEQTRRIRREASAGEIRAVGARGAQSPRPPRAAGIRRAARAGRRAPRPCLTHRSRRGVDRRARSRTRGEPSVWPTRSSRRTATPRAPIECWSSSERADEGASMIPRSIDAWHASRATCAGCCSHAAAAARRIAPDLPSLPLVRNSGASTPVCAHGRGLGAHHKSVPRGRRQDHKPADIARGELQKGGLR